MAQSTVIPADELLVLAYGVLSTTTEPAMVRASAVLVRQALEGAIDLFWVQRQLPGMLDVSRSSQLLCLWTYLPGQLGSEAALISQLWSTLSGFAHHHPYEMVVLPLELAVVLEQVGQALECLASNDEDGSAGSC